MNSRVMLLPLVFVMTLGAIAREGYSPAEREASEETPTQPKSNMKIRLKFRGKTLTATLTDNETARDFVSLLPLTLTVDDLFGREKYGRLPRAISDGGKRRFSYQVGQLIYWSPGPDVAIYYRNDGESAPASS